MSVGGPPTQGHTCLGCSLLYYLSLPSCNPVTEWSDTALTQPPGPGPVASAPLLEDAVDLLQHVAQALVLGCPAGQGHLKQAGPVSQNCPEVPAWPQPHSCPPRPKCCCLKGPT